MEKYPLKGNNKSIALQSLVGGPNKNITRSGNSSGSITGVTYQSVNKNKKVMCSHNHSTQLSLSLPFSLCLYLSIDLSTLLSPSLFSSNLISQLNSINECKCNTEWEREREQNQPNQIATKRVVKYFDKVF